MAIARLPRHRPGELLQRHWPALLLVLPSLAIAALGEPANALLRFDRPAIGQGEWWRFLSGNLAHLGWSHTLLNLAGLGLIWGLFAPVFDAHRWLIIMLVSGLGVTLGLWFLNPQLQWYVGLSGLLHGLFVAGAIGAIRRGENREAILLAAIVIKLIWEQTVGPLPGTAEMADGPVIVDAHLYGAVSGALIALCLKPRMWCD